MSGSEDGVDFARLGTNFIIYQVHYKLKTGHRMDIKTSELCIRTKSTQTLLPVKGQGPVVQKLINANPRLKVNRGFHLAHKKWF